MDKDVNTEAKTTFCAKNLRMRERVNKIRKERERHKEYLYSRNATVTNNNNNNHLYKGYKVTLYSDSLRASTLYAIYINSLN